MRSATASRAVSISTGTRLPSRRSNRQTSSPSMSGSPMSSTTASGTLLGTVASAPAPLSVSRTSYPASWSARRSTSRSARSSSTTSSLMLTFWSPRVRRASFPTFVLRLAFAQRGGQDAIDEGRRLGAAEPLGDLHRLVDRALGRYRLVARQLARVQQLRQPGAQNRSLQRRDPV